MPLPRLRIRTLMLLVVVVALALAIRTMRDQRREYLWIRDRYARDEFLARRMINLELAKGNIPRSDDLRASSRPVIHVLDLPGASLPGQGPDVAKLENYRARLKYYGDMKAKYERAASHPWILVPPDPPEPMIPE